ncbi:oxidase [Dankookia rubra]|uniref:Oxidase n=2 Tax=Dankookia rubra TaxID=1442381 RepID=A0A4V3A9X0_9PROT|nr:oxidase [Dankookia rubra]
MVLLVATLVGAYLELGRFNLVLSLGIAVAKAALVVVFFMQLKRPDPLLRLAACAGLVFLAFMFTLTYADVLTRAPPTQPGTVMPRSIPDRPAAGQRAF